MKKITLLLLTSLLILFVGCKNDDDKNDFDYPIEYLHGTWDATHLESLGGGWFDIQAFDMSATFQPNGSYYGIGLLGKYGWTYQAIGSTITIYLNETKRLTYTIISLDSSNAEVIMNDGSDDLPMKLKKR